MTLAEALKEGRRRLPERESRDIRGGRTRYIQQELRDIRDGNIPSLSDPSFNDVKEQAKAVGLLRDFYDVLISGLCTFISDSAHRNSKNIIFVIDEIEAIGKELVCPLSKEYKMKVVDLILKKIRQGYTELEEAAIYMREKGYPIK